MRTSTFHAYNGVTGGELARQLDGWRDEGLSLSAIRDRLRDQHIVVSVETVRRWLRDYVDEAVAS